MGLFRLQQLFQLAFCQPRLPSPHAALIMGFESLAVDAEDVTVGQA